MLGLLRGLVTGLKAAELTAKIAEQAASNLWRAEIGDVRRGIVKLRERAEAFVLELETGGPAGPPFDPP